MNFHTEHAQRLNGFNKTQYSDGKFLAGLNVPSKRDFFLESNWNFISHINHETHEIII